MILYAKMMVLTLIQCCLLTDQEYGGCIGCDIHLREVPHHEGST